MVGEDGKCKCHEDRPPICRTYPVMQGDSPILERLITINCGFAPQSLRDMK